MKNIRILSNAVIMIGVMMIVGAAGASDAGITGISETFGTVLLSFSLITAGKVLKEISKLKFKRAEKRCAKRVRLVRNTGTIKLEYKKAG